MVSNNYKTLENLIQEDQLKKDLSLEEKYEKIQAKLKLLQAENEIFKKLEMLEWGVNQKK